MSSGETHPAYDKQQYVENSGNVTISSFLVSNTAAHFLLLNILQFPTFVFVFCPMRHRTLSAAVYFFITLTTDSKLCIFCSGLLQLRQEMRPTKPCNTCLSARRRFNDNHRTIVSALMEPVSAVLKNSPFANTKSL